MSTPTETLSLTVNGGGFDVDVRPGTALMYVLRNELGMKGVRAGCTIGECGSCTVLVDGVPRRSCLTPVSEVIGASIMTSEGLGTPDAPHPVQCAFLDEAAAQCGYCVNGMIVTVSAGVEAGGYADRAAVQQALEEHICRCGTHERIIRAALRASGHDVGTTAPLFLDPADGLSPAVHAPLPTTVTAEPRIARWLQVDAEGRVEILAPKVEIGQGILEAMRRMVASQLGVPLDDVVVARTDTSRSVNLGHTAGSYSVDQGGVALAHAAVALRRTLLALAAERLGVDAASLRLEGRAVVGAGRVAVNDLIGPELDAAEITADDLPDWTVGALREQHRREDLTVKLTGAAAYLQDLELAGMIHVRTVLPPTYHHEIATCPDPDAFAVEHGLRAVVRDGRLLLVFAATEADAIRGANALRRAVEWKASDAPEVGDVAAHLRAQPASPAIARSDDGVDQALAGARPVSASFSKPYDAHAPISPSVAVALRSDEALHVWSHTQSPFPLRNEIAVLVGLDPEQVVVQHVDGPGCYGMSGSDDAGGVAAVAAMAMPGVAVRYQHSIDDEFGWDPHGSAMTSDLTAGLDDTGRIVAWRTRTWTDDHLARPDGRGDRLIPAWLREDARPRQRSAPHDGGYRDTVPYYAIPAVDSVANYVQGPLRTGSLRSLGSYFNVFAVESFMDELAEQAGQDPVAFRLAHLEDPRARRVLEVTAERCGWEPRVGPSGRGLGIAFARYKESKAYVAQAVEVDLDAERGTFAVRRIWMVCDAGTVVDPEGLRHQLEGATLQSLSRVLYEESRPSRGTVRERDLSSYRVLRFPEVPELDVAILDRTGFPPVGAGESGTPALGAAIANAIDDAIGIRLRELPLTPRRLEERMLSLTEQEMERVRLG
jgi:nicotinate dehydrogenase subunit B